MRSRLNIYVIEILLAIISQLVPAQTEKTGVLVEVTTNQRTPDEVKARFTNFIKGRLLKLNNVELVNNNEDYKINVMMFQNRTSEGENLGYVISTIFLAPSDCEGTNNYEYITSVLSTSKESELDSTAQNISSSFKQNVLDLPGR